MSRANRNRRLFVSPWRHGHVEPRTNQSFYFREGTERANRANIIPIIVMLEYPVANDSRDRERERERERESEKENVERVWHAEDKCPSVESTSQ